MTERKNRFGFESIQDLPVGKAPSRRRGSGPMSSAVRETAENVAEATEARVEARHKNSADAKAWREAAAEGRVLLRIPVDQISTDDLPRDRLDLDGVASSDEMDELKSSIRAHGQKEPIEVYPGTGDSFNLKKGWRRLTALRALHLETGDAQFTTALARVDDSDADRLRHYVDMVEENILREDLTFAEMAQVAVEAAIDPGVDGASAVDMVNRLYASLHKVKRSYIRAFVTLLELLGDDLRWPKAIARDQGVALARLLKENPQIVSGLKRELFVAADQGDQATILSNVLQGEAPVVSASSPKQPRQKFEFHVGSSKVTARRGEFRIKTDTDFTELPRDRLERAVAAFHKALLDD